MVDVNANAIWQPCFIVLGHLKFLTRLFAPRLARHSARQSTFLASVWVSLGMYLCMCVCVCVILQISSSCLLIALLLFHYCCSFAALQNVVTSHLALSFSRCYPWALSFFFSCCTNLFWLKFYLYFLLCGLKKAARRTGERKRERERETSSRSNSNGEVQSAKWKKQNFLFAVTNFEQIKLKTCARGVVAKINSAAQTHQAISQPVSLSLATFLTRTPVVAETCNGKAKLRNFWQN